jgi:hypothetical protein
LKKALYRPFKKAQSKAPEILSREAVLFWYVERRRMRETP